MGRMKDLLIEAEDLSIETGRRHTVYLTEDSVHILDDDEHDEWLAMLEQKAEAERLAQSWPEHEDGWRASMEEMA